MSDAMRDVVRGRLTDAEKEKIRKFGDLGKTAGWIAKHLNRSVGTVYYAMLSEGLMSGSGVPRSVTGSRQSYLRKGREVHPFNDAEDELLERRRKEGLSYPQLAVALVTELGSPARGDNSIKLRLLLLAARAEIDATST